MRARIPLMTPNGWHHLYSPRSLVSTVGLIHKHQIPRLALKRVIPLNCFLRDLGSDDVRFSSISAIVKCSTLHSCRLATKAGKLSSLVDEAGWHISEPSLKLMQFALFSSSILKVIKCFFAVLPYICTC